MTNGLIEVLTENTQKSKQKLAQKHFFIQQRNVHRGAPLLKTTRQTVLSALWGKANMKRNFHNIQIRVTLSPEQRFAREVLYIIIQFFYAKRQNKKNGRVFLTDMGWVYKGIISIFYSFLLNIPKEFCSFVKLIEDNFF